MTMCNQLRNRIGEAQSIRTRLRKECIERAVRPLVQDDTGCCRLPQRPIQSPTTPNQLTHILDVAIACPILYVTPFATSGCQPTYTEPIPPLLGLDVEPPQGPAVTNVYRKFSRIGGIEQISKSLVGRSGSDRTARLRAGLVSQSQTRYSQTVLPIVSYPPCLPPSPQPGVPVAVSSVCNLGARRVDFSNPRA